MSQENVAIVRRANALSNARDWDALFELFHPDIEWRDLMHAADVPEVLHGVGALRGLASGWDEAYDEFAADVAKYIELDSWVICDTLWSGTGKSSGTPVELHSVDAYEVQGGKIVRSFVGFADVATALEAVGPAE